MIPFTLQAGVIAAAEITTVITDKVPEGHIFTCLSCLAMDITTAIATYIEIGIAEGKQLIPVDSTPGNFAAQTSMTIYWPFILGPGKSVYAKFATPTAGDQLLVVAHGVIEPIGGRRIEKGYDQRHAGEHV